MGLALAALWPTILAAQNPASQANAAAETLGQQLLAATEPATPVRISYLRFDVANPQATPAQKRATARLLLSEPCPEMPLPADLLLELLWLTERPDIELKKKSDTELRAALEQYLDGRLAKPEALGTWKSRVAALQADSGLRAEEKTFLLMAYSRVFPTANDTTAGEVLLEALKLTSDKPELRVAVLTEQGQMHLRRGRKSSGIVPETPPRPGELRLSLLRFREAIEHSRQHSGVRGVTWTNLDRELASLAPTAPPAEVRQRLTTLVSTLSAYEADLLRKGLAQSRAARRGLVTCLAELRTVESTADEETPVRLANLPLILLDAPKP